MLSPLYLPENLTGYLNEQERKTGNPDFDYALKRCRCWHGRTETVKEKGFYILPSDLFTSVRDKARGDSNLNETWLAYSKDDERFRHRRRQRGRYQGLFDDLDVNSSKLGPTVAKA